ncbi:MAG: alpha/beta fold hydrolase [Gammaproteobacteria bacterium]|nr:alpha/beta fold hydrolase [Gammaproteobacteria bacterium]
MTKRRIRFALLTMPGVFLVACVVVGVMYQRDIQAARARISSGSQIAQTACGPIEYAAAGEGAPVLVVHGAGGGFDQGLDFGMPLTRQGFSVIAVSRFGYLRTPLPEDAAPAAQADAHACLLDALHLTRVAVIGMSAGGPSSLQFAIRYPQRTAALVLVVPGAYYPGHGGDANVVASPTMVFLRDTALRSDFIFWAAIRFAPETMTRLVLATDPALVATASAEEQAEVAVVREHILPVAPRRIGLLNETKVMTSLERYPLENIHAPTLAISAEDDGYDTYNAARYTVSQIPGARFLGFPSGGHLLVGHTRAALNEITRFLREHP